MTARFVLDEWSWRSLGVNVEVLSDAIYQLLERLDVARKRNEGVAMHEDFYETVIEDSVQIFSVLFERDGPVQLDHDLTTRLSIALDRTEKLMDHDLSDYYAEILGDTCFAPGVVWAHSRCLQKHQVAVLPLPSKNALNGRLPVTVSRNTIDIAFVTDESQHVAFFRSAIMIENANEAAFERVAPSAFPNLDWAEDVWQGLKNFSRPYINVRDELTTSLGGLSDHGAQCFYDHRASNPQELGQLLSAKIGYETSDENGATKRQSRCRRDRTRFHLGTEKVFWWHVKLQPHIDRIHFLYEPLSSAPSTPEHGKIVVGLFKDHCKLP